MDENQVQGGAGPALASHSKDASAPGVDAASRTTGSDAPPTGAAVGGSAAETVSRLSDQARDAMGRVGSTVSGMAGQTAQTLSGQGSRAAEQVTGYVREQPLVALAVTGVIGLAIGMLLGRR